MCIDCGDSCLWFIYKCHFETTVHRNMNELCSIRDNDWYLFGVRAFSVYLASWLYQQQSMSGLWKVQTPLFHISSATNRTINTVRHSAPNCNEFKIEIIQPKKKNKHTEEDWQKCQWCNLYVLGNKWKTKLWTKKTKRKMKIFSIRCRFIT